jgi:DNA-binding transcriptional LysR family regulator
VDWDKLRIFQAAAEAGSFTHAGDSVGLSQSAVSRQVSALEADLEVPLFHRHARGLILTEQGELLFRTVKDVMLKLDAVKSHLTDSREKPNGELRITTTYGMGTNWLAPRLGEFHELYPDIKLKIILSDEELDLSMREADLAIRLRQPVQPDLIQRRLFTVHFHAYASAEYLKKHGQPLALEDLDKHRILAYGGGSNAPYLNNINALPTLGRDAKNPRTPALTVNNITALHNAVEKGVGIAILPDYMIQPESELVRLLSEADMPELDCYLVYPEEVKSVARVQVFRDFLVSKASRWQY